MSWRKGVVLLVFIGFLSPGISIAQKRKLDSLSCYVPPRYQSLDSSYGKKYPLVDFDKNYFQFYSEKSPNWDILFQKIEAMVLKRNTKLNFYHIGGSHIQADIYTHDMRTSLQTTWRKLPGERGWVFPFDLARTNNPWNYDFKSTNSWTAYRSVVSRHKGQDFGTMGLKIVTSDSLVNIKFKYDRTEVKPGFSKIRVFHNKGYFPYDFNWGRMETMRWKTTQDTTLGYTEFEFVEMTDSFDLLMTRNIMNAFPLEIYGFQLMNSQPGISYNSIGVNGAGLYNYLDCKRFEEQLRTLPPDFFAFSVGTNDGNVPYADFKPAVYKANLDSMMAIVLRANPKCAILLTVPNDSYYHRKYLNRNIAREREVIIELAKEYEVPVWDLYGLMGELGSSKKWYYAKLMKSDYVHFTAAGYHLKGELFFDAFQKFIHQFGERKLDRIKFEKDGKF